MTILSICIPSFNRLDCLENCLESILISSQNVKNFEFEVCISDNFSDKDPIELIKKYKKNFKIIYNRNNKNLGFASNAIKSVKISNGKFVWMIGNDDLILPNTLKDLKKIFVENIEVEFFFINSYHLNSKYLENFTHPFQTSNLNYENMTKLSKVKSDKEVGFWDIIDPEVSWDFLIGIFLSIFKRDKWLDGLKYINQQDIKDTNVWSNFDNTCLNAKIISTVFKNEKSFICSKPLSVNLIGEREWASLYEFIEIVRIPELIDYYRSQGMGFGKYIYCKNYALRNFFNFFVKIIINGDKAGKNYVNFYKHFLKNLIYPYAWLSIIFFAIRTIKKTIKL
jgi:glycosyltransferase involved in cell wall biosynthesis